MFSLMFSPSQHAPLTDPLRRKNTPIQATCPLAQIKPGQEVQVTEISPALTPGKKAHLLAYGVTPGQRVKVLQNKPLTIVQIDFTELALDNELANAVQVSVPA